MDKYALELAIINAIRNDSAEIIIKERNFYI